jgi:hypothetical protein
MESDMKGLVEKFLEPLRGLPGFTAVLALFTPLYTAAKGGPDEISAIETFWVALMIYVVYRIGSWLDPVFDKLAAFKGGTSPNRLDAARNRASKALFHPLDQRVIDFPTAKDLNFLGAPGLYKASHAIARSSWYWEKKIAPSEEYSKAARTLFVLTTICLILLLAARFASPIGVAAAPYVARLPVFATPWFQLILCVLFATLYYLLRKRHMIALYTAVADNTTHLPIPTGSAVVLFDLVAQGAAPNTRLKLTGASK